MAIKKSDLLLYRYREVNSRTLEQLLHCEVWGSSPTTFNDPFDSIKTINYEEIRKRLKSPESRSKEEDDVIHEYLKDKLSDLNRDNCHIASFTHDDDNPTMWTHYAHKATGFVLIYYKKQIENLKKQISSSEIAKLKQDFIDTNNPEMQIYFNQIKSWLEDRIIMNKVNYTSESADFTQVFISEIDSVSKGISKEFSILDYFSNQELIRVVDQLQETTLKKSTNWSYENEYRVVVSNVSFINSFEKYRKLGIVKPIGVIIGKNMNIFDKYVIVNICKKLGIKVFKSIMSNSINTNKFETIEYTSNEIEQISKMNFKHAI